MKDAANRSIVRWIHIVFNIPILGYIYSPIEEIPKYAARVRFVVVPVMLFRHFECGKAMSLDNLFREDWLTRRCKRNDSGENSTRIEA